MPTSSAVRLQSESPGKYLPPWPAVLLILLTLALAFFGLKSWYFPNMVTLLLVAPVVVITLIATILMIPRSMHLYETRLRRYTAAVCMVVAVPLLSGLAYGVGVPALVLRMQGPDSKLTATVSVKRDGSRRCRRKIILAEFSRQWGDRLCLTPDDFARMREGQSVVLDVRKGLFGTLAFTIQPAD
jgi:uncharacterized membrane protein